MTTAEKEKPVVRKLTKENLKSLSDAIDELNKVMIKYTLILYR